MRSWTNLPRLASLGLILSAGACAAPNMNGSVSPSTKAAGEMACLPTTAHPVCKSTFSKEASASLRADGISTGTALVDGKSVTYTCYAGNADRQQPRQCRW
ncbi:MAG: hypothetical protein EBY21_04195 [Alphaproteobacteria bacterium]|nr:hypothetical protein [Alphaproteobacteria bacterium]